MSLGLEGFLLVGKGRQRILSPFHLPLELCCFPIQASMKSVGVASNETNEKCVHVCVSHRSHRSTLRPGSTYISRCCTPRRMRSRICRRSYDNSLALQHREHVYACMYLCICALYVDVCTYICTWIYVCRCLCMYLCMYEIQSTIEHA